jgi:hypothetical protein
MASDAQIGTVGEPLLPPASMVQLSRTVELLLSHLGKVRGGSDGKLRMSALGARATLCLEVGELSEADVLLRKALKLAQLLFGERSLEFMELLNLVAVLYSKQPGELGKAEVTLTEVSAMLGGLAGKTAGGSPLARARVDEALQQVHANLGAVMEAQGRAEEAAAERQASRGAGSGSVPAGRAPAASERALARGQAGTFRQHAQAGDSPSLSSSRAGAGAGVGKRLSRLVSSGNGNGNGDGSFSVNMIELRGGAAAASAQASVPGSISTLQRAQGLTGKEANELMGTPVMSVLDAIARILGDSRRAEHIELLFRTALAGAYGDLSKLDEHRVSLRLALLLMDESAQTAESAELMLRARAAAADLFGENALHTATVSGAAGMLLAKKGDLESAEELMMQSLKVFRLLETPDPREASVYNNLAALLKLKGGAARKLPPMDPVVNLDFAHAESATDLSPEPLAAMLRHAMLLEKAEKGTPMWYNWRGVDRKRALFAYLLEVFRDLGRNWDESSSPHYLCTLVAVRRRMGLSRAVVVAKEAAALAAQQPGPASPPPPAPPLTPSLGLATATATATATTESSGSPAAAGPSSASLGAAMLSGTSSLLSSLLSTVAGGAASPATRPAVPSLRRASTRSATSDSSGESGSKIAIAGGEEGKREGGAARLDPGVDLAQLLERFFKEMSPSKADKDFLRKTLEAYKGKEAALISTLEAKYNVTFRSNGTWTSRASAMRLAPEARRPVSQQLQRQRAASEAVQSPPPPPPSPAPAPAPAPVAPSWWHVDSAAPPASAPDNDARARNRRAESKSTQRPVSAARTPTADDVDQSGTLRPDVSLKEVLTKFYNEFAPERAAAVESMLEHFKGRHKALFSVLQSKYNVRFLQDGSVQQLDED